MSGGSASNSQDLQAVWDHLGMVGCSGETERLSSRLALVHQTLDLAGRRPAGARFLDVGCGRGALSITLALLGAEEVCGIDTSDECLVSFEGYLQKLPDGIAERCAFAKADASQLPTTDSRFDVVYMIEVCSHFLHLEESLSEAFRVLAPGGCLIISDGNNALNPLTRRAARQRWVAKEAVPPPKGVNSYVKLRAEWVVDHHPDIPVETAWSIARGTAGQIYDGVEAACEEWLSSGRLPTDVYRWPAAGVNPEGWYDDRLLHPGWLCDLLSSTGFARVRGVPFWGVSSPTKRALNSFLAAVPAATMPFARGFRVVATK